MLVIIILKVTLRISIKKENIYIDLVSFTKDNYIIKLPEWALLGSLISLFSKYLYKYIYAFGVSCLCEGMMNILQIIYQCSQGKPICLPMLSTKLN